MSKREWTPRQRQCIEARGGTVLVSAAAGSGKTSVLVERVIRRLTDDESPVDADRLLVVTFTKAAAAEMKQRLSAALSQKMANDPHNRRLQRQQMLLPRAHISTIHSFCSSLLREHFHLLDLSPQFKVAEDTDIQLLLQDAMGEVLETSYEEGDPAFLELAALLGSGRDDRGLGEAVLKLYRFIQSHPFPDEWLRVQESLYADDALPENTEWGRLVRNHAAGALRHSAAMLRKAWELSCSEEKMAQAYSAVLQADMQMLLDTAYAFEAAGWDEGIALLRGISFGLLGILRQYPDDILKKRVTGLRDDVKRQIQVLPDLFCGTADEFQEDIAALRRPVSALCGLVRRFSDAFESRKRQKQWVDFNDLEHLSLRLLLKQDGDGHVSRTALARELAAYYEEVLVDEYQDTNAAQDALFSAISREEQNLFMVGDVKQSIYGFRQAMPEIFMNRQRAYRDYDGTHFPAAITLGNNFRSRQTVTDSVNFVFSQLMGEDLGGIVYDEHHALIPSASYPEREGYETAFYIVDDTSRDDLDTKDAAEARLIAARIREWMETLPITEGGEQRPARFGDFCILLRSKSTHASVYVDELARCGIPAWTASSGGFFAAPEVAAALSLLRLIDNPMQDVPLLAVMLSPVGGFIPDDLAAIRSEKRQIPLYAAVRRSARDSSDPALARRCADFLERMEYYRRLAAGLPADQFVHRLLEETGLTAFYSVRSHSEQRIANLRRLHEYARQFEQGRFRGLSAFVRYLDRLEQQHMDLSAASTLSEHANVVRVISIHHSKGLEFPVVFLAGLGHAFNLDSTKGALLMQAQMGIGLVRQDPETRKQFPTLPRQAVSLAIRQAERAEELRVLYVAMTRAKEKLCLVMTAKDPVSRLTKLASSLNETAVLPAHTLLAAQCLGDWLLLAALRHPSGGFFRKLAGEEALGNLPSATAWKMEICPAPAAEEEQEEAVTAAVDPALISQLKERFQFVYPYAALTQIPSKLAASALSHQAMAADHIAEQRPSFWEKQPLSAAERGTAMHTFMEHADYLRAKENAAREADRLLAAGILSEDQRQSLNMRRLERFFGSPLCRRMLQAPDWRREQRFTVDIPLPFFGYTLPDGQEQERIVVQGIADSVFLENGGWVIVDYKTDTVSSDDELASRYREQLRIYAYALERVLRRPVRECWLYSFSLNRAVRVETSEW